MTARGYLRTMMGIEEKLDKSQDFEFNLQEGKVVYKGDKYVLEELVPFASVTLSELAKGTEQILKYVNPSGATISMKFHKRGVSVISKDSYGMNSRVVSIEELDRLFNISVSKILPYPEKVPEYDERGKELGTIDNIPRLKYELNLAGFTLESSLNYSNKGNSGELICYVHRKISAIAIINFMGLKAKGYIFVASEGKSGSLGTEMGNWKRTVCPGVFGKSDKILYSSGIYNGFSIDLSKGYNLTKDHENWSSSFNFFMLGHLMSRDYLSVPSAIITDRGNDWESLQRIEIGLILNSCSQGSRLWKIVNSEDVSNNIIRVHDKVPELKAAYNIHNEGSSK